jgi:hypothetical protein
MLVGAAFFAALMIADFLVYSLRTFRPRRHSGKRYEARRATESRLRVPLWGIGVLLLFGTVPLVAKWAGGVVAGGSFTLAGLITGVAGFIRSTRPVPGGAEAGSAKSKGRIGWIAPVGAALLIYGIPLLSFAIAEAAYKGGSDDERRDRLVLLCGRNRVVRQPQLHHDPSVLPRSPHGGVSARRRLRNR